MARVALATLPDEGAAAMVRGALNDVGIEPEFERVFLEHPYLASILAEPWRVFVAADQLAEAQAAVARLIHDMGEEVDAQAMAWSWQNADNETSGHTDEAPARRPAATRTWRPSRATAAWALVLTILIPFLTIGYYLRLGHPSLRRMSTIGERAAPRPRTWLFVE